MTSTPARDHQFLTELVNQLDQNPRDVISGRDIAETLDIPREDVETIVQRLKARGYLEPSQHKRKMGQGVTSEGLAVTPRGYDIVSTGLKD